MKDMEKIFQNKLIFGKYKIIKKIGKGAYSSVFVAKQLINQKMVAMKIQDNTEKLGNLEKEAYYLYELKDIGIPTIISYGHYRNYNILVEELLGKTIGELFKENKTTKANYIRLKDMLLAGIQIIDRIKHIHSKDIIHLDIKPNNFLVGNPDNSLIYIIDFGFAKKYRSSRTGKHIQFSKNKYFNGNLIFSSLNTMRGIEPSRRDDLESIGYMLIYLYTHRLPWTNLNIKNELEHGEKIYNIKKLIPIKMICEDTPKEMIEYMKYVKSLKFEEKPNYDYLTKLFEIMLQKINLLNDMNFSWINQSLRKNSADVKLKNIKRRRISPFSKIFQAIKDKKSESMENITKSNINKNFNQQSYNKGIKYVTIEDNRIINNNIKKQNMKKLNSFNNQFKNKKVTQEKKIKELFKKRLVLNINNNNSKNDFINDNYYNNNINKNTKFLSNKDGLNSYSHKNNQINKKLFNKNIRSKFFIAPIISNKIINIYPNNLKKINNNYNKGLLINFLNNSNKTNFSKHFLTHNNTKDNIDTNIYRGIRNKDNNNIIQQNSINSEGNKKRNNLNFCLYSRTKYQKKFIK